MNEVEYQDKSTWMTTFAHQRPDLYLPESWSEDTKAQVAEEVRPNKMRTAMFASIPLKCHAEQCPFAESCPLQQKNIAPKGYPCPIEMSMVQNFMQEYMMELGVDPGNLVEVSMVRDIVDQEIQYLRKTMLLSQEHFIQENVVGVDSQGNVVMKKELHMAVELEDRLHRRKKDLRNQLLATRESRAKVGQVQLDPAQTVSKLIEDVARIKREQDKELRKQLGLDPVDEYIEADIKEETSGRASTS